jgi:hypothetical protein
LYDVEKQTVWKVDWKYLEIFEMSCWRKLENISWTNFVKNKEVSQALNKKRNVLCTIKQRKVNWIHHTLHRNFLLNYVIEGKTEGTGRHGRRCKQLLNDLKEMRRYWKLEEEVLHHTIWRSGFGRDYESVILQAIWWWWWW